MMPIRGEVPSRTFPFTTLALVALNVGIFIRLLLLPADSRETFILNLALIPHELTQVAPFDLNFVLYNAATLFTSMFVHAGILHLGGNLLYLWIFGGCIEDVVGHGRFLVLYLLCGIAGSSLQIAVEPRSEIPIVGASGAIAGILAAYVVMFPTARIMTAVFLLFFVRLVPIPALIVIGIWLLIQLINAEQSVPGGVAWFAHLGGFAAGLVLIVTFRKRRIRHSLY